MRRRATLGTLALVLLGAALSPLAARAADTNAWTASETYIASNGGVRLHTTVFRPAGISPTKRTPVILDVSPYKTSGAEPLDPSFFNDPAPSAGGFATEARIFEKGYSFVEVALRGYGASTGCYDEGGPGEQADVKAAVEWAATQPWSSGRVGMIGHSYDGQTQLMALGQRPRGLAAVIPSAPPSGYINFFTNGVAGVAGRGFGAFYLASDLLPPSLLAPPEHQLNALQGPLSAHAACYVTTPVGTFNDSPTSHYWKDRDLNAKAAGSSVPTMWIQGFDDYNVRASNFPPLWSALTGPKRAFLGPWDHSLRSVGRGLTDEMLRWMDAWVKNDSKAKAAVLAAPSVSVQEPDGRWRAEAAWPPADAGRAWLPILPGRYTDGGANFSETELPPFISGSVGVDPKPLPTGQGSWTFSAPLTREVHMAGAAEVLAVTRSLLPRTTLVALLYDIDPAGNANLVARGAKLLRQAAERQTMFDLYPNDWRFAPGHRIGLLLTGADGVWLESGKTFLPVTVLSGTLTLPALAKPRTAFLRSGPFRPQRQPAPFVVPAATIASRTAGPLSSP